MEKMNKKTRNGLILNANSDDDPKERASYASSCTDTSIDTCIESQMSMSDLKAEKEDFVSELPKKFEEEKVIIK